MPRVLQLICLELVQETDPPALLIEVHHDAAPLRGDHPHGGLQLPATVAPPRAEHVAGETLGVHPHQHLGPVPHVPVHQRDVLRRVHIVAVAEDAELAVGGGQPRLGHPMHQPLVGQPVRHELRHRNEREPVPGRDALEIGPPRHRPVGVQYLADHARRVEPREARQVHARLGLADALQHAPRPRPQREHVPGTPQVGRHRGGIDRDADGRCAVGRGDAGRHPEAGRRVDRDGEGRLVRLGILLGHLGEPQGLAPLRHQREADEPTPVRRHEVDHLGRDRFGGADQVALVLAGFVVGDDHQLARADVRDGLRYVVVRHSCLTYFPSTSPST